MKREKLFLIAICIAGILGLLWWGIYNQPTRMIRDQSLVVDGTNTSSLQNFEGQKEETLDQDISRPIHLDPIAPQFQSLLLETLGQSETEGEIMRKVAQVEQERKQKYTFSSFKYVDMEKSATEQDEDEELSAHLQNTKISAKNLKVEIRTEEEREQIKASLEAAKSEIMRRLTRIYHRYEFNRLDYFHSFLVTWNIPARGWDILKYKFIKKIYSAIMLDLYLKHESNSTSEDTFLNQTRRLQDQRTRFFFPRQSAQSRRKIDPEILQQRIVQQQHTLVKKVLAHYSTFVMVFTGSGTTAGTDNRYEQSYPALIERELTAVLSLLNVTVNVMNMAQQNVHCELMNYCFESLLPVNLTHLKLFQQQQQQLARDKDAPAQQQPPPPSPKTEDAGLELDLENLQEIETSQADALLAARKEVLLRTYVRNLPVPVQLDSLAEIDFINWENSYYCLHRKDNIELLMRIASNYRAVLHFSSSASYLPFHCRRRPPAKPRVPRLSPDWTPQDEGNKPQIRVERKDLEDYRFVITEWNRDSSSIARYITNLDHKYRGVAPHGYNTWGKTRNFCLQLHAYNYSVDAARSHGMYMKSLFQWTLPRLAGWMREQLNFTRALKQAGNNLKKVPKKLQKSAANPFIALPLKECDGIYFFSSFYSCAENKGPGWFGEELLEYGNPMPSFSEDFNVTNFRIKIGSLPSPSSSSSSSSKGKGRQHRRTRSRRLAPDDWDADLDVPDPDSPTDSGNSTRSASASSTSSVSSVSSAASSTAANTAAPARSNTTVASAVFRAAKPILFYPTKGLHLLRAEVLLFNYLLVLLDAIFTVESDLRLDASPPPSTSSSSSSSSEDAAAGSSSSLPHDLFPLLSGAQNRLDFFQSPVPGPPMYSRQWESRESMTCYTHYQPTFRSAADNESYGLSSLVLGKHSGWELVALEPANSVARDFGLRDLKYFYQVTLASP